MTDVLELNALQPEDRPQARIKWEGNPEGELFNLLLADDMTAVEMSRLARLFYEHDKLWEAEKRTKAEDTKLIKLLDELAGRLIPDAPADAVKALSALTKRSLAVRFFVQAGAAMRPAMAGLESSLGNSSPD